MEKQDVSREFFQAINANREELARAIIKTHPDVDINCYGAIHWAAVFERFDMIDLLLSLGAELNTYKLHDSTPLSLVMSYSDDEKRLEYMKKLLNAGAKADLGQKSGETPLFSCRHVETFNLLVEYGADVNAILPSSGWSLLMTYTEGNHKVLVKQLLKNHHFTLINHSDKYGYTALIIAIERGFDDIMRLLVENGADVNSPTPSGRSIYEIGSPKTAAALRVAVEREQTRHQKQSDLIVAPVAVVNVREPHPKPVNSTPKKKKKEEVPVKSQDNVKSDGFFRFFRRSSAPSAVIKKSEVPETVTLPTANAVVSPISCPENWGELVKRIEALEQKVQEQQYKLSAQDEELQSLRRLIQK